MSEHAGCSLRLTRLLSYLRSLTTTSVLESVIRYPLRRGFRPMCKSEISAASGFANCVSLFASLPPKSGLESIRHFEIPVKHLISERRIQGITRAGAGDLDALEAPCAFRAYDLGRKPLALTL